MLSLGRSIVLLFLLISFFEASNASTLTVTTSITNSISITTSITNSGSGTITVSGSGTGSVSISTSGTGSITVSGSGTGSLSISTSTSGTITNSGSGSGTWTSSGSWSVSGSQSWTMSTSVSVSASISASKTATLLASLTNIPGVGISATATVNGKAPGFLRAPAHRTGQANTCGNGKVEFPEECDLGTAMNALPDSCCRPTCFAVMSARECNKQGRKAMGTMAECMKPQSCGQGKIKGNCASPKAYSNGKPCKSFPNGQCVNGLCRSKRNRGPPPPVAPPAPPIAPPAASIQPSPNSTVAPSPQPVSGVQPIPT